MISKEFPVLENCKNHVQCDYHTINLPWKCHKWSLIMELVFPISDMLISTHHNDVISKELPTLENFKTINGFGHYQRMEKGYSFHVWYFMVNHRKTTKRPLKKHGWKLGIFSSDHNLRTHVTFCKVNLYNSERCIKVHKACLYSSSMTALSNSKVTTSCCGSKIRFWNNRKEHTLYCYFLYLALSTYYK